MLSSMMKLAKTEGGGERYWFWCAGCETHHVYTTKLGAGETGPVWTGPGPDLARPTFSPSLLCNGYLCPKLEGTCTCSKEHARPGHHRCHIYVRAGMVQYLGDCSHHLAGQTVPVEPPCF